MDVPITVYPKTKKMSNGANGREHEFNIPTNREIEDAARKWEERNGDTIPMIDLSEYQ